MVAIDLRELLDAIFALGMMRGVVREAIVAASVVLVAFINLQWSDQWGQGLNEIFPGMDKGQEQFILSLIVLWLIGTATWCVARAFDPDASWLAVAPAAILSWIIGFVSVPVPGGIGVREAAFVAVVGTIPTGVRATVAVAARLCFILVDAGGAALGAMAWRRWTRAMRTTEAPPDPRS